MLPCTVRSITNQRTCGCLCQMLGEAVEFKHLCMSRIYLYLLHVFRIAAGCRCSRLTATRKASSSAHLIVLQGMLHLVCCNVLCCCSIRCTCRHTGHCQSRLNPVMRLPNATAPRRLKQTKPFHRAITHHLHCSEFVLRCTYRFCSAASPS